MRETFRGENVVAQLLAGASTTHAAAAVAAVAVAVQ